MYFDMFISIVVSCCQVRHWDWIRHWLSESSVVRTSRACEPQTVCTHVGVWSIVSWWTWLALFRHVMTGRHQVAGHVILWAARVWPAIKLGAGSRVTSSAGSRGRQTSCPFDATCICEFNDVHLLRSLAVGLRNELVRILFQCGPFYYQKE